MKTITIYEKGDKVQFKRRGKLVIGKIVAKWAKGEGDGYGVEVGDDYFDVAAKSIVAK